MGVVLLLTIIIDDFFIQLEHSLVFVAGYHVIASLPNILQGLERVNKWKK